MSNFLAQARDGDYVAFQAYLTENEEAFRVIDSIRRHVRDNKHLATTFGYGPRFLHSTGQYHKGGPNTGLFIQLTADDSLDFPIGNRSYSFGMLRRAQAQGDLEALRKHERRVVRVNLGSNVLKGLLALKEAVTSVAVPHG
jgi:transaldolase/glucose-6-phosphate isomerase